MTPIVALVLFLAAYVLFAAFPRIRTWTAVAAAGLSGLLLAATGAAGPMDILRSVNWNVMGIFVGTLAIADAFTESRVPAYLAERLVNRSRSAGGALLAVCALTGILSAFVENVATVLIVAPIALSLARRLEIDPRPVLVGIAVSSNLQGAATLIGDPPSMLLGGYADMGFLDFFFFRGRPGIFFAVELGAVVSMGVLWLQFKGFGRKPAVTVSEEKVASWIPTVILGVMVALLAAGSVLFHDVHFLPGAVCMALGAVSLAFQRIARGSSIRKAVKGLDWETTAFLACVFILVGGLTATGWIEKAAHALSALTAGNELLAFLALTLLSVVLSAFVDNVPFLAAMLPVATGIAADLGVQPHLLLFALLIGASLGGNITPIGASANIVACGLLSKEGKPVSFRGFMRIGVPFTLAALAPALLFLWIVWR